MTTHESENDMTPKRIQRKRTKGWRMPEGAVYVGRGSKYGNPYRVGEGYVIIPDGPYGANQQRQVLPDITPRLAVDLYRLWLSYMHTQDIPRDRPTPAEIEALRGKNLACWCPVVDENGDPVPCHADVLLELANKEQA